MDSGSSMGSTNPGSATSGNRRRGLGRGLGALIVNTQHAPAPELDQTQQTIATDPTANPATDPALDMTDGVRLIALDQIEPNPQQPRAVFDPEALEELAASIRTHGIIQPLIVTSHPEVPGRYWLIAGERRWRAARLALLDHAPAIVREASPLQLVEWALVENLQRADLNPLEEAAAYQTLVEEFALTQAEIGQRVGKSRSAIANTIRLLQLPRPVQEALGAEQISAGHGRALLALSDDDSILQALDTVLKNDLTVRQTEELVKRMLLQATQTDGDPDDEAAAEEDAADPMSEYMAHLEARFREALGTRVSLSRGRDGSGRLTVHFYNEEDLASLYQLIVGVDDEL